MCTNAVLQGWVCPLCEVVKSPYVEDCKCAKCTHNWILLEQTTEADVYFCPLCEKSKVIPIGGLEDEQEETADY